MAPSRGVHQQNDVTRTWTATEAGEHLRGRRVRDTKPEVEVRRALHALGLRFRLGRRIGRYSPDLVFPRHRVAVFVDGCFWHGCPTHGPTVFRGPNADRWRAKLATNRQRDGAANATLAAAGWHVVRIWECEIKRDARKAADRVRTVTQAGSGCARSGTRPQAGTPDNRIPRPCSG